MSAKRQNLTQHFADHEAAPPARGNTSYADAALPGFALRVTATGHKSWIVTYRLNGRQTRYTVGTLAMVPTVKAARDLAREALQQVRKGIDPAAPAKAARATAGGGVTLADAAAVYLAHVGRKNRPNTHREYARIFNKDIVPALGRNALKTIERAEIREILDAIADRGGNPMADHTMVVLRAFFRWCCKPDQAYLTASPIEGIDRLEPPGERDRCLTDSEIVWFWQGCESIGEPFGPLFKLLLLTGQRLGEVGHMTWPQVEPLDARQWTIPAAKAKNALAHHVPLSAPAAALVEARPVFETPNGPAPWLFTTNGVNPCTGYSKGKARVDAAMIRARRASLGLPEEDAAYRAAMKISAGAPLPSEIAPWRLHDLRRTMTSGMARLGVAEHVCDKILNHKSGVISGVKAVYNRYSYLPERQAGLELWARHIVALIAPPPADNVIPLPLPDRAAGQ